MCRYYSAEMVDMILIVTVSSRGISRRPSHTEPSTSRAMLWRAVSRKLESLKETAWQSAW